MGLDMAKYRRIFLEESSDHLGEVGRALLDLEKEMANGEAIDTIFRMAHSMKSMAASLGYEPVAELAHRLEDRMEGVRAAGCVRDHEELALLFRGLESLEAMVAEVNDDCELTPPPPELIDALSSPHVPTHSGDVSSVEPSDPDRVGGEPKKVQS
jgi:two-component system chemotaxis sensor kinase CheA